VGDRDAQFLQFVDERSAALLRLAYLLCGEHALAEDLVQIALVRAYPRWRRLDDPLAYVRRVLVSVAADEGRRAHRRREQIMDDLPHRPTAGDETTQVDDRAELRAALAMLPARQRAAVVLRYWLDLDPAAAADLLGCAPETVRSQSARGLAKLREAFGAAVAHGEGERDD
jgi:RNA polymerase sigma-70 factor (sigma-E family)